MTDLDQLEALARAAGGGQWTASDSVVWFDDGDSAMQVMNPVPVFITHDNLGTWPDPIAAEDVATFAASVCPAAILALIAEVRALREDAERYRWLRDWQADASDFCCASLDICLPVPARAKGEPPRKHSACFDAAIDAARGAK